MAWAACRAYSEGGFPGGDGVVSGSLSLRTGRLERRVNLLPSLPPACLRQVATCVRTTATASVPCTGRCTRCAGSWAPAVPRPPRPRRSCPSGSGTCRGRCACAPALCPAWPTASARRRGSSRALGSGPSRASFSPRRRCRRAQ